MKVSRRMMTALSVFIFVTFFEERSAFLLRSHSRLYLIRQHQLSLLGQKRKRAPSHNYSNYYCTTSFSKCNRVFNLKYRTLSSSLSVGSLDGDNNKKNLEGMPVEDIFDGEAWLDAIAGTSVLSTEELWKEISSKTVVQGGTLRTCSFDGDVERVEVFLKTNGRPLHANVELWQGHTNCPQKMTVYVEDGDLRSFRASVESPGSANSISIRNTGKGEYPLIAGVKPDHGGPTSNGNPSDVLRSTVSTSRIIQGGAVYITPFPSSVQSIQVMLESDGRPLNARVELLQGPNNIKQVMDIYSEDACERTFFTIIETPGAGNVVRIVNTATVEFPLTAIIEPYTTDDSLVVEEGSGTWS